MQSTTVIKPRKDICCNISVLKYVLFIFNFFFFLSGIAVFSIGLWTYLYKLQYVSLLPTSTYPLVTYLFLVAGSLVLMVTIIGCVAIWREDKCALIVYTFALLLIFLIEAIAGVLSLVYEQQIHYELESSLNATFTNNYMYDKEKTRDIESIQRTYKCCGGLTFSDWKYSKWFKESHRQYRSTTQSKDERSYAPGNSVYSHNYHGLIWATNNTVPDSCCRTERSGCGVRDHPSNIYYEGCLNNLEAAVKDQLGLLALTGLGICLIEVIGLMISCCLFTELRRNSPTLY